MLESAEPLCEGTDVLDRRTWRPKSLADLRSELEHVLGSAAGAELGQSVVFLRGQADATWSIRSTFARHCKGRFDEADPWYGNRIHQAYLDKFLGEMGPSPELRERARSERLDEYFELMRRMQQHPHEFEAAGVIPGTNLLDWTQEADVALAFAAEDESRDGALLLFDIVACGQILIQRSLASVLTMMQEQLDDGRVSGLPIIFSPPRQSSYLRVERQRPYYVAQMDLRYPLEHVLEMHERATSPHLILRRIILTPSVKAEIDCDLAERGRSREWLLELET